MLWKTGIFCALCLVTQLFSATNCLAQEEESEATPETQVIMEDTIEINDQVLIGTDQKGNDAPPDSVVIFTGRNSKKIPRKAALYAAALPGLGQVYNGAYWKVPIVYGTFITLGWFATWYNDQYLVFRRAYIALDNGLPEQNPLINSVAAQGLTQVTNNLETIRRQRDFMYILMAGAYALQIMEAIVDAHLIEFDVSEELSLEIQPSAGQYYALSSGGGSFVPAAGLSLFLNIK
ncbi:DUF5683 domain-containing protein [Porifericola rhodea]|uniref:DUF5683 domain-containing protein n=1 Tax=Porifericola rhodea TaxID=930972 RepID=UPI002665498D|nr:DUF5683 domain-containing protein [Porifericola rhodea]WKN30475.1 DUF5683 domain-containing protein [Porifericola rhodea]